MSDKIQAGKQYRNLIRQLATWPDFEARRCLPDPGQRGYYSLPSSSADKPPIPSDAGVRRASAA
jgi:hypothetical protein